jgi:hypothetical protein
VAFDRRDDAMKYGPKRITLASLLLAALAACQKPADPTPMKEESPMNATAAPARAIPPIDAAAPAVVETATFATG